METRAGARLAGAEICLGIVLSIEIAVELSKRGWRSLSCRVYTATKIGNGGGDNKELDRHRLTIGESGLVTAAKSRRIVAVSPNSVKSGEARVGVLCAVRQCECENH